MQGIYKNTYTAVRWLFFHGLVTLFIFCGTKAQGQHKQYNFNNPGNECFMEYILNPPNGVFESIKRPFVIVVGKQGETAAEALQRDSIWKEPAFHHYMFVYLPGSVARQTGSSLNLTNPSTSISNAYGIFTGLSSDTLMLEVKKE